MPLQVSYEIQDPTPSNIEQFIVTMSGGTVMGQAVYVLRDELGTDRVTGVLEKSLPSGAITALSSLLNSYYIPDIITQEGL